MVNPTIIINVKCDDGSSASLSGGVSTARSFVYKLDLNTHAWTKQFTIADQEGWCGREARWRRRRRRIKRRKEGGGENIKVLNIGDSIRYTHEL